MLTVLLLLAVVLSLSLGTPYVAPADVLRALSGAGTPYDLVVFDLRLPRVVLAAVAGAAFGVAGTLIQSVARNPLASPDVIGITQGAGLAATVALTSGCRRGAGGAHRAGRRAARGGAAVRPRRPARAGRAAVRARRGGGRVRASGRSPRWSCSPPTRSTGCARRSG